MNVDGTHYRTVWMEGKTVFFIDQNRLPFEFIINRATSWQECCRAIREMNIRGAGAIGALAGFAMALAWAARQDTRHPEEVLSARREIEATRPTARNLYYATELVFRAGMQSPDDAIASALKIADRDAEDSRLIGIFGNSLIQDGHRILTHCNAGWLAFVDFGTALAPIYLAHQNGKKVFVYVDETRPRGQGARLTAWELSNGGVPCVIVPDNAGAWLMAQGKVDIVITGADRIATNGDTANKIGTLEKAIAAREHGVPFYIAAPTSTIDRNCVSGEEIVIEERPEDEVLYQEGPDETGVMRRIRVAAPGSHALNYAFDVTPVKYITGFITEKGVIKTSESPCLRSGKPEGDWLTRTLEGRGADKPGE